MTFNTNLLRRVYVECPLCMNMLSSVVQNMISLTIVNGVAHL